MKQIRTKESKQMVYAKSNQKVGNPAADNHEEYKPQSLVSAQDE